MTPEQHLERVQPLLSELWQALAQSLTKAGLEPLALAGTAPTKAVVQTDAYDQSQSLHLEWRTPSGGYLGQFLVHANQQCYAEFDVFLPHPTKPEWVVEAATAWGLAGNLKTELRLLPALGE